MEQTRDISNTSPQDSIWTSVVGGLTFAGARKAIRPAKGCEFPPRTRTRGSISTKMRFHPKHAPAVSIVTSSIAAAKQTRSAKATLVPGGCG